jgi:hypothetical protein
MVDINLLAKFVHADTHMQMWLPTREITLHAVSRVIFDALPGTEAAYEANEHHAPFWFKSVQIGPTRPRKLHQQCLTVYCSEPPLPEPDTSSELGSGHSA